MLRNSPLLLDNLKMFFQESKVKTAHNQILTFTFI